VGNTSVLGHTYDVDEDLVSPLVSIESGKSSLKFQQHNNVVVVVVVEETSCRTSPNRRRRKEGERVAAASLGWKGMAGLPHHLYLQREGAARAGPLAPRPRANA
jgi:hypothetical protein